MKKLILFLSYLIITLGYSQEDLIKKISGNQSQKAVFSFQPVLSLDHTSVKSQGKSGTCWSYSGNSFLESEILRMGKKPVDIAEIYTARNVYLEKAKNYILMNGAVWWGDGGELHDVINMYKKYGTIPQESYTGLITDTINNFDAMQAELKPFLDSIIKSNKGKINPNWQVLFNKKLDKYLGKVPDSFTYNNKTYTPITFANEVIGLNPKDYIEITSYKDFPYYTKIPFMVPDNWSFDYIHNVPMKDLTEVIDYALSKGMTVGWATDVSEPYFSWKNGLAYVPYVNMDTINKSNVHLLFENIKPEKQITEQLRQDALNDLSTTDDHGMQIVGISKNEKGEEFYVVKNSWGATNDLKGYVYASKSYVLYKTTAIMVHKDGIPPRIRKELGVK